MFGKADARWLTATLDLELPESLSFQYDIAIEIFKIVTLDKSYPTAEINLMFWEYEFKNETVEYNQFRTLINYLKYNN